jgi:hypothetical protein
LIPFNSTQLRYRRRTLSPHQPGGIPALIGWLFLLVCARAEFFEMASPVGQSARGRKIAERLMSTVRTSLRKGTPPPKSAPSEAVEPQPKSDATTTSPPDVLHHVALTLLKPLLNTLTESERAALATAEAQQEIQQRPRSRGRAMFTRPLALEVAVARVDGQVVGALLLKREWAENTFAKNCNRPIQETSPWPSLLRAAMLDWLNELNLDLGPWLLRQLEVLPEELDLDDEHGETIVDALERASPDEIDRWLSVPSVLRALQRFRKGDTDNRERVRAILLKWTTAKRGRHPKQFDQRLDIATYREVESTRERFAHALPFLSVNWNDFRDYSSVYRALEEQGFTHVAAYFLTHNRNLTPENAAIRFIAKTQKASVNTIRMRYRRGQSEMSRQIPSQKSPAK